MVALERIYNDLQLGGFDQATPRFHAYLNDVKSFRKNIFRGDSKTLHKVGETLGPWIGRWGYQAPQIGSGE